MFQTNVYITITHARRNVAAQFNDCCDWLLTVLMSKVLTLPVVSEINFRVESIALAKTQRLASFRPAASAWETMNVSSDW